MSCHHGLTIKYTLHCTTLYYTILLLQIIHLHAWLVLVSISVTTTGITFSLQDSTVVYWCGGRKCQLSILTIESAERNESYSSPIKACISDISRNVLTESACSVLSITQRVLTGRFDPVISSVDIFSVCLHYH